MKNTPLYALLGLMLLSLALCIMSTPVSSVEAAGEPSYVMWAAGPILDQKLTPECVGYSLETFLEDAPDAYLPGTIPSPDWIYFGAQARDGIDDSVDGTLISAGITYLQDYGYVQSVEYTHDIEKVASFVLNNGPVEISSEWDYTMDVPNSAGVITPTGFIRGYHAYVCDGYDRVNELFDCQTSWGTDLTPDAHFKLSYQSLGILISAGEDPEIAEAALPRKSMSRWLQIRFGQ